MRSLLWLLLVSAAASAQPVSPPDGIHLTGSAANITFRWAGGSPDAFLEVTAGRATVFSGAVKGQSLTLPLQPGPLYRWKVSPGSGGHWKDPGVYYSFQFQGNLTVNCDGAPGRPGPLPQAAGQPGGHGGPGGPGQNVAVSLAPAGDFVQVLVVTPTSKREIFLVPGSAPLIVTASGGPGGPGAEGAPGLPGQSNPNYQTGYVYSTPGGPGGNGGQGGDGGPGGQVTVRSAPGLPVKSLLTVIVGGGVGGPGGPGGLGGPAPATYYNNNGMQAQPGVPGPPGQPGQNGRQGAPGISR